MTPIAPLDRVIRHVNKETVANGSAEKIICLDTRTRTVLERPPLFGFLMDVRYYLVCNASDPRNMAQSEVAGQALQSIDLRLPVTIAYTARCRPGSEGRAAVALYDPSLSVGEVLDRHVMRWITTIGQDDIPAFVSKYLEDREAIETDIAGRALTETGLNLTVRLSLDWEKMLAPINVSRDHLRVLTSDFQDEEQDINVKMVLDLDDRRRREAILRFREQQKLQDLVPREVVKFFREHVPMQMFAHELHSAALRQNLTDHLNQFLGAYGRKVGNLRLDGKDWEETFFQGEHSITCELHEYPKPVIVRCKVQMIRKDEAQYRSAKSPDLKKWLAEKLERYVRQYLFGARYLDVLIHFDDYEGRIRGVMNDEARAIGYHIEQLFTGPELEPLRWREPFPIEIDSTPFETLLSRFYVNLQFAVTARIPRLDSVKQYLNRDQNVPNAMRDAIVAQTRRVLHAVDPERFYMRFTFSDKEGETPVEEALVSALRTRLQSDFDAEVYDVVVKIAETELISRLRKLMETICPFVVEMTSLHGRETLVFRGNFQVDGVDADGWHRFQLLTLDIDGIKKLLEEHLLAELDALTPNEMQYRDPRHRKKLELVFTKLAERFVREQFGLVIRVTNVRRDPTPHEIAANQKLLGDDQRRIEVEIDRRDHWAATKMLESREHGARLAQLYEERRLLTTQSGTEGELAELDRKIEAEKAELLPENLPTFADVRQKVLPEAGTEATLQDVARLAGFGDLFTGETKKLIEGGSE